MKRFAGVGLPATSGDHRACWSRPRRDLHTGASSSSAGRRLASERAALPYFCSGGPGPGAAQLPSPRRCVFCPCLFTLLSLTAATRVLWPHPEETSAKATRRHSPGVRWLLLRLPRNGECISITVCLTGSSLDSCRLSSDVANKTITVLLCSSQLHPRGFEVSASCKLCNNFAFLRLMTLRVPTVGDLYSLRPISIVHSTGY